MTVRVRLYDAGTDENELRRKIEFHAGEIETINNRGATADEWEAVAVFPAEDAAQDCIDAIEHYSEHGTTVNDLLVRGFE